MFNVVNLDFARKRFEKINGYYGQKGLAPQLSIIRIEENLVDGQGDYTFQLNKEILNGCEKNLKRNDLFVCLAIGVALRIEDSAKPNSSELINTVNTTLFATEDLKALYNGSLYVATGTSVNFEAMPTLLFKRNDSLLHNAEDAAQTLAPELILAGTQDHVVKVSFPTFASANFAPKQNSGSTLSSKIVFYAIGYRVVGGTSDTYKNDPANPYAKAI